MSDVLLELADDHYDFASVLDEALRRHAGAALVRPLYDGTTGGEDALDVALAALGLPGLTVDDRHGGAGLAVTECLLAIERLGQHLVPTPVAEGLAVVAPLLGEFGDDALRESVLPRIAAGRLRATVQDGWTGWAPWAASADLVAVVLDDRVVLVEPAPGSVETVRSPDRSRRLGRVGQDAPALAELGPDAAVTARRRAAVMTAALLSGVSSGMIESATEYAKVRTQFGAPIGSFQAVKHLLAEAFVAVEGSRRTAWWASLALDEGSSDVDEAVSTAKATIGQAAVQASYASMQVYGGLGYTWECDLHFWMKRAQALQGAWGSTDEHLQVLDDSYANSIGRVTSPALAAAGA